MKMTQHYENLDATFQDLHDAGGVEMQVYASDLNTKHIREFSYRRTRDVPLAICTGASASSSSAESA
jgi:hypothetical protein